MKNISYEKWLELRSEYFNKYPVPPLNQHLRLDIELSSPQKSLSQIPVKFNPHLGPYSSKDLFYDCDDWSVIFDVHTIANSPHKTKTLRMLVESGHKNPWGEKIRLMSTAHSIFHEWWATYQNWHDFAFFRNRFWKVTWNETFGGWPTERVAGLIARPPDKGNFFRMMMTLKF